jgi:hypothetical protein
MYDPSFCMKFEPYLDPETYLDEDGDMRRWEDRSLVKNAPQSAIAAFEEYKKLKAEDRKKGIIA